MHPEGDGGKGGRVLCGESELHGCSLIHHKIQLTFKEAIMLLYVIYIN